ncbi:hypothetical protein SADUNF_Sadunf13G0014200 [Salix dunnii]|uniref:Uncharacterized protein n=1 Tax=Salix dunnii TaxID=1413687 RepID=A0A835JK76_9ROSI|nr:hypothetical protein SADUNF_Sadunf13G0014200 [Salix dunnii]
MNRGLVSLKHRSSKTPTFFASPLVFPYNGLLFTGGEDRNITEWDVNSGKAAYCIDGAHSARVKGIVVLMRNDNTVDDPYLLASASSDGLKRPQMGASCLKEAPDAAEGE